MATRRCDAELVALLLSAFEMDPNAPVVHRDEDYHGPATEYEVGDDGSADEASSKQATFVLLQPATTATMPMLPATVLLACLNVRGVPWLTPLLCLTTNCFFRQR